MVEKAGRNMKYKHPFLAAIFSDYFLQARGCGRGPLSPPESATGFYPDLYTLCGTCLMKIGAVFIPGFCHTLRTINFTVRSMFVCKTWRKIEVFTLKNINPSAPTEYISQQRVRNFVRQTEADRKLSPCLIFVSIYACYVFVRVSENNFIVGKDI